MDNNANKELILISNNFPVQKGETFLAIEYPYLEKVFNSIRIIVRCEARNNPNKSTLNYFYLSPHSTIKSKLQSFTVFLKNPKTNIKNLLEESVFLRKKQMLCFKNISTMLHDYFKALEIKEHLKKEHINDSKQYIIYSYWQNAAALGAALLSQEKNNCKSICRAHGGDLYAYRTENNYLSFRTHISRWSRAIFFISDDGLSYQREILKKSFSSFKLARLGTENETPLRSPQNTSSSYTIVSCSNVIPLKRIHLIIETLALCSLNISWLHFGDGYLMNSIKEIAEKKLSHQQNISFSFQGHLKNTELLKFYANNAIDLFINVSETEGIPVSIMEAMSYGIPAIATNVGGTSELVDNTCGRLLDKDCCPRDIANAIEEELVLDKSEKAFKKWDSEFNAKNNYTKFAHAIKHL